MNRKFFAAGLLSVAVVASGFLSVQAFQKEPGFISVSKSITREISPNRAEITVKIETSDLNMKMAVEKNKLIANNVYTAVKNLLDTKNGDFIKTGEYSAQANYNYKDGKRIFDKYNVVNSVTIKLANTEKISKIIDTSISQGATTVDDIKFSSTDYEKDCNEMLATITAKAYYEAAVIANSAKSKVKGIKSLSTSCSPENSPHPFYRMMAAAPEAAMSNAVRSPIESGKLKLYANIDASFFVK